MKNRNLGFLCCFLMAMALISCASMGATNTTATNVGITSYETAGATLTQAYNIEKMLLKSKVITAKQDEDFQLGAYTKAVTCYKAIGSAAVTVLTTTDSVSKASAQDKFNTLSAELPGLVAEVLSFIDGIKK